MIYDDEEGVYVLGAREGVECPQCESEDVTLELDLRSTRNYECRDCGYYFTITHVAERP